MRSVETLLVNPLFGLFVALVLVVIGPKLSPRAEAWILTAALCLLAFSVFRVPVVLKQDLIPTLLFTLAVSSLVGMGCGRCRSFS